MLAGKNESGSRPQLSCSTFGSEPFLEAVWEEFFRSRHRGRTLEIHFPWIRSGDGRATFLELSENGRLIGGLVLRELGPGTWNARVGAIGLVCVVPEARGRGWSRILLEASIRHAREAGFDALTLWTGKWKVYEPLGFILQDSGRFGWVESGGGALREDMPGPSRSVVYGLQLPPFAMAMERLQSPGGSVTLVEDGQGPILADWTGDPEGTAELLLRAMPSRWRMNSWDGDTLCQALRSAGCNLDLAPTRIQMWLPLRDGFTAESLCGECRVSVLDRI